MPTQNVFRIQKRNLWKVLREIRDHYEENHPLAEAVIDLGAHDPHDTLGRLRAHREILERLGGRAEPLPELIMCEEDDTWLLLPLPTGELFTEAWVERNWAIVPVLGDPRLFSPADSNAGADESLRSWLNTQLREGRCVRYPLLDAVRLRREADYMLAHDTDIDIENAATVGIAIRV